MRGDVMRNADLAIFAEIGLVLFLLGFLFVIMRLVLMKREDAESVGRLPLDDGQEVLP